MRDIEIDRAEVAIETLKNVQKDKIGKTHIRKKEDNISLLFYKNKFTYQFVLNKEKKLIRVQIGIDILWREVLMEKISKAQVTAFENILEEFINYFNLRLRLLLI